MFKQLCRRLDRDVEAGKKCFFCLAMGGGRQTVILQQKQLKLQHNGTILVDVLSFSHKLRNETDFLWPHNKCTARSAQAEGQFLLILYFPLLNLLVP